MNNRIRRRLRNWYEQDGGRGDVRDFFLFWARINGVAPTKAQYEV